MRLHVPGPLQRWHALLQSRLALARAARPLETQPPAPTPLSLSRAHTHTHTHHTPHSTHATNAGASDCGSCVAILLEVARTLVANRDAQLAAPIVFLFNGGEETLSQAANGFFASSRCMGRPRPSAAPPSPLPP